VFSIESDPPDEVLLGFKKIGFGAGKYTGIGGKVEPDETIVNAALRELEEEIGVKASEHNLIKLGQLTFLFPANPAWSQVVHVFQVTEWKGDPAESDEMKPAWFGMNQLPLSRCGRMRRIGCRTFLQENPCGCALFSKMIMRLSVK